MTIAVTRLTLLSPLGMYPPNDIVTDFGRFVIDDDIAFIVTRCTADENFDEAERYSEIEFLTVEEIRFLGCLTLACPESSGMLVFYPIPENAELPLDLMASRAAFLKASRLHAQIVRANICSKDFILGSLIQGPAYSLKDDSLIQEQVERLCGQVDMSKHILIRALGCLIKADMLWMRQEFREPATIMLHISLAATQEMIFNILRGEGNPNPSSKDASKRLALAFGEVPRGDNYFQDFYEDRNTIIHPWSRRGEFSYPPLAADDFYDLRPGVIAVLVWLIIGDPTLSSD